MCKEDFFGEVSLRKFFKPVLIKVGIEQCKRKDPNCHFKIFLLCNLSEEKLHEFDIKHKLDEPKFSIELILYVFSAQKHFLRGVLVFLNNF